MRHTVAGIRLARYARVRIEREIGYGLCASMKVRMWPWLSRESGVSVKIVSLLVTAVGLWWSCVVRGCGRCVPFPSAHELLVIGRVVEIRPPSYLAYHRIRVVCGDGPDMTSCHLVQAGDQGVVVGQVPREGGGMFG